MKPITFIFSIGIVIALAVLFKPANAKTRCDKLRLEKQISLSRLGRLSLRRSELDQEFKDLVTSDFDDKSNRDISSFSENRAKKVFFVKRKLEERIDGQERKIRKIDQTYCEECSNSSNYCDSCPKAANCLKKNLSK